MTYMDFLSVFAVFVNNIFRQMLGLVRTELPSVICDLPLHLTYPHKKVK